MSILKAITKRLIVKVVDIKVNSLKRKLAEDSKVEEIDKAAQELKDLGEEYEAETYLFCRMHPDHPLCQKSSPRYKK